MTVTFTATASDPDGDTLSYKWSLAGADNAPAVSQIFTEAGSYPVSVTVSDGKLEASASTTVTVTEPGTNPVPPTDPANPNPTDPNDDVTLNVTASPGGPVPWGVTYEVKVEGKIPEGSTLSVTCADQRATDLSTFEELEVKDVFSCIHLATGEKIVATLKDKSGKVLTQKEQAADVQTSTGVPFEGAWKYEGGAGSEFYTVEASFNFTQAVDAATGRGEGIFDSTAFEGNSGPQTGVWTVSAKKNTLALNSSDAVPGLPPVGKVFVFVGAYDGDKSVPTRKQVFYTPDTQYEPSDDEFAYDETNAGFLYSAQ